MKTTFELCNKPDDFFEILPEDWQAGIVPYWKEYHTAANIYIVKAENKLVAGGILFNCLPPDPSDLDHRFNYLFAEGYLYIGFLFVQPEMRHLHLGSWWLDKLKKKYPGQKYWLTIEEEALKHFYQRNGFEILGESDSDPKEWVLTYNK